MQFAKPKERINKESKASGLIWRTGKLPQLQVILSDNNLFFRVEGPLSEV
jgi:hypothetical protein